MSRYKFFLGLLIMVFAINGAEIYAESESATNEMWKEINSPENQHPECISRVRQEPADDPSPYSERGHARNDGDRGGGQS